MDPDTLLLKLEFNFEYEKETFYTRYNTLYVKYCFQSKEMFQLLVFVTQTTVKIFLHLKC